eukprot:10852663-Lingulodinium_polyedra.AAC.1
MSAHGGAERPPLGDSHLAAQHGLAHPPTWARHLSGPVVHMESQSQIAQASDGAVNNLSLIHI